MNILRSQVKHVYERCGFDASSSPTTLYMLSDLEARLEDLLSDIGQMPEEYVAKAEKASTSKKGGYTFVLFMGVPRTPRS